MLGLKVPGSRWLLWGRDVICVRHFPRHLTGVEIAVEGQARGISNHQLFFETEAAIWMTPITANLRSAVDQSRPSGPTEDERLAGE